MTSVTAGEGPYVQTGCAPNFEGGLITLCTRKHSMRAFKEVENWPGQWIAGFTSVGRDGWDRHPHSEPEQWHRDILDQTAVAKLHRVPALLVGDQELSFLWDAPKLCLPGRVARTKCIRIAELLDELREVQS